MTYSALNKSIIFSYHIDEENVLKPCGINIETEGNLAPSNRTSYRSNKSKL